jgi:hypothetical protein
MDADVQAGRAGGGSMFGGVMPAGGAGGPRATAGPSAAAAGAALGRADDDPYGVCGYGEKGGGRPGLDRGDDGQLEAWDDADAGAGDEEQAPVWAEGCDEEDFEEGDGGDGQAGGDGRAGGERGADYGGEGGDGDSVVNLLSTDDEA